MKKIILLLSFVFISTLSGCIKDDSIVNEEYDVKFYNIDGYYIEGNYYKEDDEIISIPVPLITDKEVDEIENLKIFCSDQELNLEFESKISDFLLINNEYRCIMFISLKNISQNYIIDLISFTYKGNVVEFSTDIKLKSDSTEGNNISYFMSDRGEIIDNQYITTYSLNLSHSNFICNQIKLESSYFDIIDIKIRDFNGHETNFDTNYVFEKFDLYYIIVTAELNKEVLFPNSDIIMSGLLDDTIECDLMSNYPVTNHPHMVNKLSDSAIKFLD